MLAKKRSFQIRSPERDRQTDLDRRRRAREVVLAAGNAARDELNGLKARHARETASGQAAAGQGEASSDPAIGVLRVEELSRELEFYLAIARELE